MFIKKLYKAEMKNKIILIIVILSMMALIFSGCDGGGSVTPSIPDNEETSDYFRLDVPYIEQNSSNTCLPASAAMVLSIMKILVL